MLPARLSGRSRGAGVEVTTGCPSPPSSLEFASVLGKMITLDKHVGKPSIEGWHSPRGQLTWPLSNVAQVHDIIMTLDVYHAVGFFRYRGRIR